MFWELHDLGGTRFSADGIFPLPAQFPIASRAVTTLHQPCLAASDFLRRPPDWCSTVGAVSIGAGACSSSWRNTIEGLYRVPPLARVAIIFATCKGVVIVYPWPMATERVSPAYQGWPRTRRFHWLEGTRPLFSKPPAKPVGCPKPNACA